MNKRPNSNNHSNNWYSSYGSRNGDSNGSGNNRPPYKSEKEETDTQDLNPIKLIKERFREDPIALVAEVAFAVSIFFLMYVALWLGHAIGLS